MDWIQMVCIALVVGVIGPAFWLGVNVLENKLKSWLRLRRDARQARKATASNR